VNPGAIVKDLDGKAGVVQGSTPVPVGGRRAIHTDCEVDVDAASATTLAVGSKVNFDPATQLAKSGTPTGSEFYIGRNRVAKLNGETIITVLLNDPGPVT
jgi:hypothetical protein